MTRFFRNLSIKTKLTLVIMLSSAVLLVIISSVVLLAEIYTTWTTQAQELRILSQSIAANSRQALVLDKYKDIETQLTALIHQKNIHAAYVFDAAGTPVAEYINQRDSRFVLQMLQHDFSPENKSLWHSLTSEKRLTSVHHFSLFTPIFYDGQRIGALYLLSDLDRLYGRISGVAFGITLSLLVMVLLSWLLAGYLQKPISMPLLQLAQVMDDISESQNYSVRVPKLTDDDIGRLVDGFNRMLVQIECHQESLAEHQKHLEQIVAERTAELRLAMADLERAREQADSANEAKSQFLSRMTHELRTPLIGVLGMNELLARTELSGQQQVLVETVQKSGEQLLGLIGEVLDFSRIEAGKLQLELSEFDVRLLVTDCAALLLPQAREKGLELLVDVDSSVVHNVSADATRIRQILMNLVGNAIKFTPSGSVRLSLHCSQISHGTGTFVFEIADTGQGLTDDAMTRVFDSFYQVKDCHAADAGGAGLGLAIVKQLVDLMSGTIELMSTPGEGSCFRVCIDFQLVLDSSSAGEKRA